MITAFFISCGAAVAVTVVLLIALRRSHNRAKARWNARFARPLTVIHPGEWDDHGVDGDSIARLRRSQRKLDAELRKFIRDGEGRG